MIPQTPMRLDALCVESRLDSTCDVLQSNLHDSLGRVHMRQFDIVGTINAAAHHDRGNSNQAPLLSADADGASLEYSHFPFPPISLCERVAQEVDGLRSGDVLAHGVADS